MIKVKTRDYFLATLVLSASSFLVFSNLYVVQPLLSMFAQRYSVSLNLANWIFAAASLGMSLFLIPWALLADRYGRRLVMLLSLSLSALLSFSLVLSDSITAWITLRFLQGVALAGLPAVAIAYISEEFEASAVVPAVGIYIAANSIGGISGRIFGGVLAETFGLNAPMIFTAALTLGGALMTYRYLPRERYFTAQSLAFKTVLTNLCGHIKNPLLWRTFFDQWHLLRHVYQYVFGGWVALATSTLAIQHNSSVDAVSVLFERNLCCLNGGAFQPPF